MMDETKTNLSNLTKGNTPFGVTLQVLFVGLSQYPLKLDWI
jgi:hypothetical protein